MTTLGDWLASAPFGLAMSSGFFAFYAHAGMLDALLARGLRPTHVAGSSAGALVAGAWAAGLDIGGLHALLLGLRREDFWDPAIGLGLLAGKKFDALLRRSLPVSTFAACRVPVRISVFDILARRTRVLDAGDLADAIRASCAVPGMFTPVWIAGRPYWDGGIRDHAGADGLADGRALVHRIWRRPDLGGVRRPSSATLVLDDLPRPHPFQLGVGRAALLAARRATERALDQPIRDGVVRRSVADCVA